MLMAPLLALCLKTPKPDYLTAEELNPARAARQSPVQIGEIVTNGSSFLHVAFVVHPTSSCQHLMWAGRLGEGHTPSPSLPAHIRCTILVL